MTDTLQNLKSALETWRGSKSTPATVEKSPYGKKILELNLAWAETKKAHQAKLEEDRQKYLAEVQRYTNLNTAWEQENRGNRGGSSGPRHQEHPDEVKILAAQLLREGESKTFVRTVLGVSNTARLNALLAEGEALLQAQEAAVTDW